MDDADDPVDEQENVYCGCCCCCCCWGQSCVHSDAVLLLLLSLFGWFIKIEDCEGFVIISTAAVTGQTSWRSSSSVDATAQNKWMLL